VWIEVMNKHKLFLIFFSRKPVKGILGCFTAISFCDRCFFVILTDAGSPHGRPRRNFQEPGRTLFRAGEIAGFARLSLGKHATGGSDGPGFRFAKENRDFKVPEYGRRSGRYPAPFREFRGFQHVAAALWKQHLESKSHLKLPEDIGSRVSDDCCGKDLRRSGGSLSFQAKCGKPNTPVEPGRIPATVIHLEGFEKKDLAYGSDRRIPQPKGRPAGSRSLIEKGQYGHQRTTERQALMRKVYQYRLGLRINQQ